VADGDEAVARIPADPPDIVLASLATPKRSGYDIAAYIKQTAALSHIPVLLIAGAFEPVDEVRLRAIGSDGVLVKPFDARHLVARVRELLQRPAGRGAVAAPPSDGSTATSAAPMVASNAAPSSDLDRYFEQLDAAFASRSGATAPAAGVAPSGPEGPPLRAAAEADDIIARVARELDDGNGPVPTIDDILGGASVLGPPDPLQAGPRVAPPPPEPPDAPATLAPSAPIPDEPVAQGSGNPIVDVFRLLLAMEQGERDPATIRVGRPAMATEELVAQVMRRVLDRSRPSRMDQ
jgi:CheY-like chemotaxis protein